MATSISWADIFISCECRRHASRIMLTFLNAKSPDISRPSCICILKNESFIHLKPVLSSSLIFAQTVDKYSFRESPGGSNFVLLISCQTETCIIQLGKWNMEMMYSNITFANHKHSIWGMNESSIEHIIIDHTTSSYCSSSAGHLVAR
ncbi:hypothetical protein CROQUDRAFT_522060 [Cronartium quercuum f. sp. fusiforme G11]|uniref:Uncharacterized protein n=1 Tax=Cronartium quercuum f. sp. fusiforme G11 TaxID=708437 RepID=A0A9P6TBN0_9BASI|nr:hypothetical protein CROQUDRAFT_522060 [Cronartium quercuum f. sp. fusiforme G11]